MPKDLEAFEQRAITHLIMDLVLSTALWWATRLDSEHPTAEQFNRLLVKAAGAVSLMMEKPA